MAVFKQANETLKQQLDALQRQLNSPEAATPSFVAKQRTRLAAAETQAEKAEAEAKQLQMENMQLAQQIEVLQAQLLAAGMQPDVQLSTGTGKKAAMFGEDSVVAAAEELLSGRSTPAAAPAAGLVAAVQRSSSMQQQQDSTSVSAEWKLAEIERLQEDNRLLTAKVRGCTAFCSPLKMMWHAAALCSFKLPGRPWLTCHQAFPASKRLLQQVSNTAVRPMAVTPPVVLSFVICVPPSLFFACCR
jgi:hypothetical protein